MNDLLSWIVTICTYISYIPQIIKILKRKTSDDLSTSAWLLFATSSTSYLIWALIYGGKNLSLIIQAISEAVLNLTIFFLSIKYKSKEKLPTISS